MNRLFIASRLLAPVFLIGIVFLTAHCTRAQDITPIGSDSTFDVATWNIEWFGSPSSGPSDDDLQFSNVLALMRQSGIDLWGVQEIADRDVFDVLLDSLGSNYDGVLATQSGGQRIGFIYDTRVVSLRRTQHILTDFNSAFAGRPPLLLEADVTANGVTRTITFITVHMKAFSDSESYDKRVDAANSLKNHLDFLRADEAVVLLGDYNDRLEGSITSGRTSPYMPFVNDGEDYLFPTLTLEQAGEGSFCSNASCSVAGSMIDHIMITDELFGTYEIGTSEVYRDAFSAISRFRDTASDHRPIVASFNFARNVSAENEQPNQIGLSASIFPNPLRDLATLRVNLDHPTPVQVEVFDVLGRQIQRLHHMLSAGQHDVRIDGTGWRAGTYWVRLITPEATQTLPIKRIR